MGIWDSYPSGYREEEVNIILRAVCAGECVSILGLSGSGKSNLMGFLANRIESAGPCPRFFLVDCNRLVESGSPGFFRLLQQSLDTDRKSMRVPAAAGEALNDLRFTIRNILSMQPGLCLLLDRFDALYRENDFLSIANSLRAIRDEFKYQVSYVTTARKPMPVENELTELFFGRIIWLGPLSHDDALWSARRDASRYHLTTQKEYNVDWSEVVLEKLVDLSGGYPSLLRATLSAYADGAKLDLFELRDHPAVRQRIKEFWDDQPSDEALGNSGLANLPLLDHELGKAEEHTFDESQLTAKESRLLRYLRNHTGEVCTKEELVSAVWPEDVIYQHGIRDESLAQLVRRLRVKFELDPGEPKHILTVPGRGFRFMP